MSNDPFIEIINQLLQGLVSQLNGQLGAAIRAGGFDPCANVASGSASVGIGTAHYAVSHLTGVSSVQLQDMVVSKLTPSATTITGELNFHAVLTSALAANAGGNLRVLFADPGISGSLRIDNPNVAGSAAFEASVNGGQLCLTSVTDMRAHFSYGNASIWINGLGPLNHLLAPVENQILDAAKGAISDLISSQINSLVGAQISRLLPHRVTIR